MPEPQFFDIFGFCGFIFLILFAVYALIGKKIPKIIYWLIFLISLIGVFVDGLIIYTFYLK